MGEHRVGEAGKIDVVAEQDFGWNRFSDLNERAIGAEDELERETRFFLGELLFLEEAVGERGGAEVEDGLKLAGATRATRVLPHLKHQAGIMNRRERSSKEQKETKETKGPKGVNRRKQR